MFHPLPLLLLQQAGIPNSCSPNGSLANAVLDAHNEFRQLVANGTFGIGSKSMFKLSYDCTYEGFAMALLDHTNCRRSALDLSSMGVSDNYFDNYIMGPATTFTDDDIAKFMPFAVMDWQGSLASQTLNKKALYDDETFAAFANMAYYKSLRVGCAYAHCPTTSSRLAIACVYSDVPKLGEELYPPSSTKTGCTAASTCTKVVKPSTCEKNATTNIGLCVTEVTAITTSPAPSTSTTTVLLSNTTAAISTTSASAQQTTTAAAAAVTTAAAETTTKSSAEQMTDEIRNEIVEFHNHDRTALALGTVRNGKEGNPNCPQAKNMYEMRYDLDLEKDAQRFADNCPLNGSELFYRTTGENYALLQSSTISYLDAFTTVLGDWWTEIYRNGVNQQMKYTQYLETKPNAPIHFTQMAWAATYKVGCGIKRCDFGTVVVCRYSPRGNIYTQYIYNTGTVCSSCSGTCRDSLCPAPAA